MSVMCRKLIFAIAAASSCSIYAEIAHVRVGWGSPKAPARMEKRILELERIDDAHFRAVVRKADIPSDAAFVDVVPQFMTARKGDDGYWLDGRG